MLGAIRTGKRKRKVKASKANDSGKGHGASTTTNTVERSQELSTTRTESKENSQNYSAADNLRRQLSLDLQHRSTNKALSLSSQQNQYSSSTATKSIESSSEFMSESVSKRVQSFNTNDNLTGNTVILSSNIISSIEPTIRKEDLRRGARKGKIKTNPTLSNTPTQTKSISMEIQKMIQEETNSKMSMDEIYARNISKLGNKYKGTDFGQNVHMGASAGADEVDFHGDGGVNVSLFQNPNNKLTEKAIYEREKSKQMAQYKKQTSITSKCWWWMESSSFRKKFLLSLGDHVSLVLVPKHMALLKGHCYLVPIKHAESFVTCEDEVWDEVKRFRTALTLMYAKEGKSVLFCETVLATKGLWQARMDIIPVPKHVEQDAPLHFKSALNEQTEEWGTHTKLLSTNPNGLRRTIPKNFPYVNIEWKDGGYAQIIETNQFPKDFLLDTIGSMMHMDPIRFQRKRRQKEDENIDREAILDFCKKFKDFDWTIELDG